MWRRPGESRRGGRYGLVGRALVLASVPLVVFAGGLSEAAGIPHGFPQPLEWKSDGGILSGTLEVKRTPTLLGTRSILTLTYDGTIPGPTWRVKPGDRIKIRLVNNATLSASAVDASAQHAHEGSPRAHSAHPLAMDAGGIVAAETMDSLHTNIHTHGLQVDPRGNSDNPFLDIAPGEYFDYDIAIPANQPAGLYWYHPHRHMAVSRQLWNGLAGAIIVEGGLDAVPVVAAAKERLFVINELLLDELGQVPAPMMVPTAGRVTFAGLPPVPSQIYFPVNGAIQPRLGIHPGEIQRWRILNASAHRVVELALVSKGGGRVPLQQIAQDGLNYGTSIERSSILLAPGNRVEVLVRIDRIGIYDLKALAYDQGHPGGPRPEILLAKVLTLGKRVRSPVTFPVQLIPPQQDAIAGAPPSNLPELPLVWSGQIMTKPISFELDGQEFDPTRDDRIVTVGTWSEWTLDNHDVFHHPFHIHVNPFQIVSINGVANPESFIWWDTRALPPKGSMTVRMFYRPDIVGRTVYHCHITPHEDAGMMGVIHLTPGPDGVPVGPFPNGPVPPPEPPTFTRLARPYVFTQLANGGHATIAVGREIALQLPGEPTTWQITIEGVGLIRTTTQFIPSEGQFDGANGIYVFKFLATRPGTPKITAVQTGPPLGWLGSFTLDLTTQRASNTAARLGPASFPFLDEPQNAAAFKAAVRGSSKWPAAMRGMGITIRPVAGSITHLDPTPATVEAPALP